MIIIKKLKLKIFIIKKNDFLITKTEKMLFHPMFPG